MNDKYKKKKKKKNQKNKKNKKKKKTIIVTDLLIIDHFISVSVTLAYLPQVSKHINSLPYFFQNLTSTI